MGRPVDDNMENDAVVVRVQMMAMGAPVSRREMQFDVSDQSLAILIRQHGPAEVRARRLALHAWMHDLVSRAVGALQHVAHSRGVGPQPGQRRLVLEP